MLNHELMQVGANESRGKNAGVRTQETEYRKQNTEE